MSGRLSEFMALARYGFLALFAVLLGFTANAFIELGDVQNRIRYRIPENTIWAAAQTEIELARTLAQLAPLAAGNRAGSGPSLPLQFDLLWSRAQLYRSGALAAALQSQPGVKASFDRFQADLTNADTFVKPADAGDREAALRMLELLTPHREAIRELTMTSLNNDRKEREELSRNHDLLQQQLSRFGSAAAILLGFLLLYLLFSERRARSLLNDAKSAQAQMQKAQARSEEQASQMELLARKATTASKAKTEFLAMMSHDIRTPLNAIIGLSEIMNRDETDARKRQYIETILRASDSLLSLINDILDLTRLEAGKLSLSPGEFSPEELVREVMDVTEVLARQNRNAISVEIDPDLPAALIGDRDRIRQVLMNLVGNANKFTVNGRVSIQLRCKRRRTGVVTVRFSVCDNGRGISESLQKRLFQPFEQGEDSRDARGGSTGLGLAISERLVRMMGGSIGLESEPGKGSTFSFELDLAFAEATSAALPNKAKQELNLAGLDLLVVDDTPANLLVAESMLQRLGARTVTAASGEEAVEIAKQRRFDIVVLDVLMPGMDGPTAMACMRDSGMCADAAFVAMTAYSMPKDKARLIQAGFDAYIAKPVRMKQLGSALAPLLAQLSGPREQVAPAPEAVVSPDGSIDLELIRSMAEDIGEETFRLLVNQAQVETEQALEKLEVSVSNGDREAVRQSAHKLAGLLGQFGLIDATNAARILEAKATTSALDQTLPDMRDIAIRGLSALRARIDQERVNPHRIAA